MNALHRDESNDLGPSPRPRNYLARREQWRLLVLIVGLGAVVFAAYEFRRGGSLGQAIRVLFGGAAQREGPIDTRLQAPAGHADLPETVFIPREVAPPKDQSGEFFPGVRPGYLDRVEDDGFFRAREHEAWFHLLEILRNTPPDELRQASSGPVTFAQLFQQSADYRGKLITLSGTARRAMPLGAPRNDLGIEQYYRVWLSPDDNPSSPIIVYCLELPDGFPTGMDIRQRVSLTGFYFKRLAYEAADTLRTAPTVLAATLRWTPPPPGEDRQLPPGSGWWIVGAAMVGSLLVVGWVYVKTRSGRPVDVGPPPNFDRLADVEPLTPPDSQETTDTSQPGDDVPR